METVHNRGNGEVRLELNAQNHPCADMHRQHQRGGWAFPLWRDGNCDDRIATNSVLLQMAGPGYIKPTPNPLRSIDTFVPCSAFLIKSLGSTLFPTVHATMRSHSRSHSPWAHPPTPMSGSEGPLILDHAPDLLIRKERTERRHRGTGRAMFDHPENFPFRAVPPKTMVLKVPRRRIQLSSRPPSAIAIHSMATDTGPLAMIDRFAPFDRLGGQGHGAFERTGLNQLVRRNSGPHHLPFGHSRDSHQYGPDDHHRPHRSHHSASSCFSANVRRYRTTCHASSSVKIRGTNGAIAVPLLPFFKTHNNSPSVLAACHCGSVKSRGNGPLTVPGSISLPNPLPSFP